MAINFEPPAIGSEAARHHAQAASGNIEVTAAAIAELDDVLSGLTDTQRILLSVAAGAGKSYALRRMVASTLVAVPPFPRCCASTRSLSASSLNRTAIISTVVLVKPSPSVG